MSKAPLQTFIQHRLTNNNLLVISHQCSLAQRVVSTSIPNKKALQLYKTANVIPPHKRANLELAIGEFLLADFVIPFRCRSPMGCSVVYVCCTKLPYNSDEKLKFCNIVDIFSDPYGFLNDDGETIRITNLDSIFNAIIEAASSCDCDHPTIIIDSIFPLLQASHSFSNVKMLLTKLRNDESTGPIILPVLKDIIPSSMTMVLMEMADANLIVEGGQFTILRRSIHGNNIKIVKEEQTCEFSEGGNLVWNKENESDDHIPEIEEKTKDNHIETLDKLQQLSISEQPRTRNKVELQHEQEISYENINRPNIFLDDDDPEFDDLDEEDPDDDLDI